MDYKDYGEPYKDLGEAFIEIILKEKDSEEILKKRIIWAHDFDDILDTIPLNEEGMYAGLTHHQQIEFPYLNV